MPSNYARGEAAGIQKGMDAVRVLLGKLEAAKGDAAEWKEQHENLLAMFRASEQRAVKAEHALRNMTNNFRTSLLLVSDPETRALGMELVREAEALTNRSSTSDAHRG